MIDRVILVNLYGMKRLSLRAIAEKLDCSREWVRLSLLHHGIRRRKAGGRYPKRSGASTTATA